MHPRNRHASDAPFVEYCAACERRIGMCGYTSVPEDGRTCCICHQSRKVSHSQLFSWGAKALSVPTVAFNLDGRSSLASPPLLSRFVWTTDRLRVPDIPRRSADRPPRMFPACWHSSADDVRGRLPAIHRRVPRGSRRRAATANIQRARHEFHAGRDSAGDSALHTRTDGHLQARRTPAHRSVLSSLFNHRSGCEALLPTCLSLHLSVRSYVSKTTCPNFTKLSVLVTHGLGPSLTTMQ